MTKHLFILRGIPGAGRTTLAHIMAPAAVASADDYFILGGEYKYDRDKLPEAHAYCFSRISDFMRSGVERVAVYNTFVNPKRLEQYIQLAKRYGYWYHILHVQGDARCSVHNVPES